MKYISTILLLIGLFISTSLFATQTAIINCNQYSAGDGGQFTANTSDNGTFQTFCVDVSHEFIPGDVYYYSIGNQTFNNSGNYLSIGTAYLYSSFLNNTLPNFTEGLTDAGLLQDTIWGLQHESSQNFNSSNPFYNDVVNRFGSISAAEANSNGAYGVEAMYLYSDEACSLTPSQSQLIDIQSVSERGTFGVSLFLLGSLIVLRRFNCYA